MFTAATCLGVRHDPGLLTGALLLCLAAAGLAAHLFRRAVSSEEGLRHIGLAVVGAVFGAGVWATHFVAMLAIQPAMPLSYEPFATFGSLAVAMIASGYGFGYAAAKPGPLGYVAGGGLVGGGIACMHYLGMAAVHTVGHVDWNLGVAAVSVLIGISFATMALAALKLGRTWQIQTAATVLLCVAVLGMHFSGMGAATLVPDGVTTIPTGTFGGEDMAFLVGGVAVALVLCAFLALNALTQQQDRDLERLKGVLNGVADGVAYFNRQGLLIAWNSAFEAIAQQAGLTVARGDSAFNIGMQIPGWQTNLSAAESVKRLRGGRTVRREFHLPNGSAVQTSTRMTSDGGFALTTHDVTDKAKAIRDLCNACDIATTANRAKSIFLANISHEIRTPLNGVVGVADVLARSTLVPEQAEMVEIIRNSGATLNRLLTDLIDLARVESGQMTISDEPFDLAGMVRDVAALMSGRAQDKGLTLSVDVATDADVWVDSDPVRIRQIVNNLVGNAVKFTEAGAVDVSLARGRPGTFVVRVTDSGPGFDASVRDKIFERFEQADGTVVRRHGGSGLGLTISQQIAKLLGGEIECESTPGEGSTFQVTLPLQVVDAVTPPEPQRNGSDIDVADEDLRLLIVDDNENNRRMLEMLLDSLGIAHESAVDGEDALRTYARNRFDAVLMDMQMPVMDGLTATRALRDLERRAGRPRVPVLMLTANVLPEHVRQATEAGADRHLAKPLSAGALVEALQDTLAAADPQPREDEDLEDAAA